MLYCSQCMQCMNIRFRAAKYYNELPEDIKFELDDSERYNKKSELMQCMNIRRLKHHE